MRKRDIEFIIATTDDVIDLIDVQNKAFLSDYFKYGECPGYGHTQKSMRNLVDNVIVYKIMVDRAIVGDIIVWDKGEGNYFLGCLCVIPEYENNGLGQTAMKFLEHEFDDARHWALETPAENERNVYFYQKRGFKITKEYMDGSVKIVFLEK